MFPLGSVLLPAMPLRLRVFEERYLLMLSELVAAKDARFGVVLIERGCEVGGGDHRFGVGTVAEICTSGRRTASSASPHRGRPLRDRRWLADAPHPRAEVAELADLVWDDALEPLRGETEQLVRRTLAEASEFAENGWSPDVELADEPVDRLAARGHRPGGRARPAEPAPRGVGRGAAQAHRRAHPRGARAFSTPWPEDEGYPPRSFAGQRRLRRLR